MLKAHLLVSFSVLLAFPFSFLAAIPQIVFDSEWQWLSPNLALVLVMLELVYVFGYSAFIFQDCAITPAWRFAINKDQLFCVLFLLLSALWPAFTFWGARTQRRVGPWVTFYDREQRMFGILRMWGWFGALIGFAVNFANARGGYCFLHRHLTQSAMVVYIFHKFSEELWFKAFESQTAGAIIANVGPSLPQLGRLSVTSIVIVLNFLTAFALYALLLQHKVTRAMFGIDDVGSAKAVVVGK